MHLEYEYNDGRSLARIISDPIAIQLPGVEIDLDDEQVNASGWEHPVGYAISDSAPRAQPTGASTKRKKPRHFCRGFEYFRDLALLPKLPAMSSPSETEALDHSACN